MLHVFFIYYFYDANILFYQSGTRFNGVELRRLNKTAVNEKLNKGQSLFRRQVKFLRK